MAAIAALITITGMDIATDMGITTTIMVTAITITTIMITGMQTMDTTMIITTTTTTIITMITTIMTTIITKFNASRSVQQPQKAQWLTLKKKTKLTPYQFKLQLEPTSFFQA
jgi:hypothetical protein